VVINNYAVRRCGILFKQGQKFSSLSAPGLALCMAKDNNNNNNNNNNK
jgi:hypothetical protein